MDPEHTLIRLLATTGVAQRTAAIDELLGRASIPRLVAELARLRVLPVLGERLGAAADVPPELRAAIDAARRANTLRSMMYEAALGDLTATLEERGIPVLPLKGPTLAVSAHGGTDMRDTTDLDVLVPLERLDAAGAVLIERGYTIRPPESDPPLLHLIATHPTDAMPPVEIHWRVHWYERPWSRRLLDTSQVGADGLRRATPAMEMMLLLVLYARDAFSGLRLAMDVLGYAERHPDLLTDGSVRRELDRAPELRPAVHAAAAAMRVVTGLEIDGLGRPLSHRQRIAIRLADPLQRAEREQRLATTRLVDALLSPAGGMPDFVRDRLLLYPTARENVVHAAKTGTRWLGALALIAGGRQVP